ncbi:hypothetical protein GCM10007105_35370 [Shewanella chilikensis]|nr:hypothetical protein GCM10007105_35370 [Shewanella chilikensis]
MKIDPNKEKALNAVLGQIEKQFGKGSIMKLGEDRTSYLCQETGCGYR